MLNKVFAVCSIIITVICTGICCYLVIFTRPNPVSMACLVISLVCLCIVGLCSCVIWK